MLNRDHSLPAIIKVFEDAGRVHALTRELKAEEKQHIFWESDLAKWMEGALIHLQQEPDEELNAYVEDLIDQLIANQESDGYLNSFFSFFEPQNKFTNLHCSIPGHPRRGSALRCLSSLLRPGPLCEGMTRSRTLNTDAGNAGVAYMYCKPLRIGGMSSRDFRSNSMAAMSTSPNFIWGSRMVRIKFQILKIYGKTKETSPKIL